jgi:hypothetical protein
VMARDRKTVRKSYGGNDVSQSRDDCGQDRKHDQHAYLSAESWKHFTRSQIIRGSSDRGISLQARSPSTHII